MSVEEKSTVLRYVVPLAGVAIVTAGTVTAPSVAPALFYPLYIALTLIVTALAGRGAGFVTVAASGLAISYFSLTGVAFAVSDPVDAAGLIGLIAVDILAVVIVAGYRDWLAVERARCGDITQRENAIHAITAEVSHRLKNDLASLAAIAHIGALRAEQRETADALESFGRRIDAQARIYARFDLGRGLEGDVGLQPYLRTLCEDFRLAHLNLRPIALQVDV